MPAFTEDQERRCEEIVRHFYQDAAARELSRQFRWIHVVAGTVGIGSLAALVVMFFILPGMAATELLGRMASLSNQTQNIVEQVTAASAMAREATTSATDATTAAREARESATAARAALVKLEEVDTEELRSQVDTIKTVVSTQHIQELLTLATLVPVRVSATQTRSRVLVGNNTQYTPPAEWARESTKLLDRPSRPIFKVGDDLAVPVNSQHGASVIISLSGMIQRPANKNTSDVHIQLGLFDAQNNWIGSGNDKARSLPDGAQLSSTFIDPHDLKEVDGWLTFNLTGIFRVPAGHYRIAPVYVPVKEHLLLLCHSWEVEALVIPDAVPTTQEGSP